MMRRWGFKGIAGLIILGLASASCASILGIDKDYHPFVDEGGGGLGGAGEGGAISASGSVTGSGSGGPCEQTGPEVCTDGIDNDCNGMTDCEDPACATGFVCIPPMPSGWSAVAFSANSRPACPENYATAADVVSAGGPSSCACTCTLQKSPSCQEGTIGIASNGAGECPAAANFTLPAKGGDCASMGLSTVAGGKAKTAPLPPTQGDCSAALSKTLPPPVNGRSCGGSAAAGAGCAAGGACVGSAAAPFLTCIAHDGVEACPQGFSKSFAVGASTGQDTRDCSPCTCGTSATCANPKLTFFTDGACLSGAHDLIVDDLCELVNDGPGHGYGSYRYSAEVVNGGCQKTVDTALTGSLALTGERTICCP